MGHKNFIRLLAGLLMVLLLTPSVSAGAGERLAVERKVFEYLTGELKLTTAAACGVLANMEHESAFQPTNVGDQGTSYGLCQWHNERFTALRSYCAALRLDYRTVEGQMAYLKYELGTNYVNLLLTLQAIDDTPDGAYRAAYQWCVKFEMPSNMQVKAAARGELARGKYWNRYSHQMPSIMLQPESQPPEPDPELLLEQLRQNPVTIPLPPAEEEQEGAVRHFTFEKPELIYYVPWNLPKTEQAAPAGTHWGIPALAGIAVAMIAVVCFPTKKLHAKLYRKGRFMV